MILEFVKRQHGNQKRKYTDEPYWIHPVAVSKIVPQFRDIALCHDLIEDTWCTYGELFNFLVSHGHKSPQKKCSVVHELTDFYTPENFPGLNRAKRKMYEAQRMAYVSKTAQTVKYADIIDNTTSIVKYDPGFAETYFKEVYFLLKIMIKGDQKLLEKARECIK